LRLGKKLTQKELVSNLAKDLMKEVNDLQNFVVKIKKTKALKIYSYRGKIRGIFYKNRKYRFSTLGISKEQFFQLYKVKNRLQELELLKELHQNTRSKNLNR